jgi:phosphoserine aminotransferase
MKYNRIHNFAAGPAVLPLPVVESLVADLPNLKGTGIGLMEISHRSKTFDAIVVNAQKKLADILGIPDTHAVLFLQGGASLAFLMAPMNLLNEGEPADYVITGGWSKKALAQAKPLGDIRVAWTDEANNFKRVPAKGEYSVRPEAKFLHYTTNNTLYGTEWFRTPESDGIPLVADASSDFVSQPIDVARHDLIYAGAQKNMGPSGVTIVIVKRDALARVTRTIPVMLDYRTHVKENSLYNTPCTVGIYVVDKVCDWILGQGGLPAVLANNIEKARRIYAELDRTDFWRPHAMTDSRSRMNITWRIAKPELEEVFVAEAKKAGLDGLKGHRSVGGLRASVYNACPMESIDALVSFMKDFEARNG